MESWKKIDNYDNYMISNLGNIKNIKRNKLLSPSKNTWGYLGVMLHKNGNVKRYQIHRLVANAFIPNIENKKEVNHKDGNKLNNHVDNLEWVTRSENILHSYKIRIYILIFLVIHSCKKYSFPIILFDIYILKYLNAADIYRHFSLYLPR